MPRFGLSGPRIAGVAAAVPARREAVGLDLADAERRKITASTGVLYRHISEASQCTSDLCLAAARKLIAALDWDFASIDLLVFVSQTPDYILPCTACDLHGRLGLAKHCASFDVNLGCSGYIYGLSTVATYISSGAARRALVLVGDTITKIASPDDRSVAYLFGDAGSATAVEWRDGAEMTFVLGSDGSGANHLKVPAGMFRNRSTENTRRMQVRDGGLVRSDEQLYMNGPEIFNFTIREIPSLVSRTLEAANWKIEDCDAFVFHQANKFMLEYLAKRMKLPRERVVIALEQFGNTSCASIPLALCLRAPELVSRPRSKLLLAGFGVGFSWGGLAVDIDQPQLLDVVTV